MMLISCIQALRSPKVKEALKKLKEEQGVTARVGFMLPSPLY